MFKNFILSIFFFLIFCLSIFWVYGKNIQNQQYFFYKGDLATIYVDKTLYNAPSSNSWFFFIIKNNFEEKSPSDFNLKNTNRHFYPNQWGIYTTNKWMELNDNCEIIIEPMQLFLVSSAFKMINFKLKH